ncbi:MAG: hypothetical protein QW331_04640 [Candidatus Woesearchaeota archaeon]
MKNLIAAITAAALSSGCAISQEDVLLREIIQRNSDQRLAKIESVTGIDCTGIDAATYVVGTRSNAFSDSERTNYVLNFFRSMRNSNNNATYYCNQNVVFISRPQINSLNFGHKTAFWTISSPLFSSYPILERTLYHEDVHHVQHHRFMSIYPENRYEVPKTAYPYKIPFTREELERENIATMIDEGTAVYIADLCIENQIVAGDEAINFFREWKKMERPEELFFGLGGNDIYYKWGPLYVAVLVRKKGIETAMRILSENPPTTIEELFDLIELNNEENNEELAETLDIF